MPRDRICKNVNSTFAIHVGPQLRSTTLSIVLRLRWLILAGALIFNGCAQKDSTLATASIRIVLTDAAPGMPTTVLPELQRLGFTEQANPARTPHFRIFSTKIPEEYLVGIPLDADQETHQISIFFSGPKPFGEAGVALYRNLVAGLKERLGTERVSASSTSSAGQVLLESPGRGANDVGV